jgi:hypothetical protein
MDRRKVITGGAALIGVAAVPVALPSPVEASHRRRIRVDGRSTRWTALEQDHHTGGTFPPGVADGPVSFIRSPDDDLILFQMHGNGQTYRHSGPTFESLSPGVWVHGSTGGSGDNSHYSGIASVLRDPNSSTIYGWVHQENHTGPDAIASIGQVSSDDEGYHWTHHGTLITGEGLQPSGFRGAEAPSVARDDDRFVMLYGNRYGNGRHQQIQLATAPVTSDGSPGGWSNKGEVISEKSQDPHFYAASPSLRWSTSWNRWVCLYSTDKAFRFRTSTNLLYWSRARTVVEKEQQWTQTSGYYRWYPTLLDAGKDDSSIIGSRGWISEHRLNVQDHSDRYPAWSTFRT